MEKIKSVFNESYQNNAVEFVSKIEQEIKKIFPKSYADVEFSKGLGTSIVIAFALGKDKSEWVNGYFENDLVAMRMFIWGKQDDNITREGEIVGDLELKNDSSSFVIKPTDKYTAYSRVKVPFRKATGNPDKILVYIKKYFTNFKKVLQDNRENMTDEHLKLVGDKF